MIGRLLGTVVESNADGQCVIDVQGVGYEVHLPLSALARLPIAPVTATIFVHTHVREDALILYGFDNTEDREAFRTLLTVSGVGPRVALSVLSALRVDVLQHAIVEGNAAIFKGVSGVGKKLAERILLELKDKLPATGARPLSKEILSPQIATPARLPAPLSTVFGALVNMGYKPLEAERAVKSLQAFEGEPVENLLRQALACLN